MLTKQRRQTKRVLPTDCLVNVVPHTYIGETGRSLEVRLKEHKRAVKCGDTTNGISVHANTTGHSIQWGNAEVLDREQHWHGRKLREAMFVRKEQKSMNLDRGDI
jgi:hypothetical protein